MDIQQCFLVLGLERTKDEGQIKRAYREKLTATNPEDDPEGFKRLREAYEQACQFAREEDAAPSGEPADTTPSGQWVSRAAELYAKLSTRKDVSLWAELFEDDIFQSLEEEENCRNKLLRFLMEHFRLPSEVWKLFDKKMHLAEDAASLREIFPADFINYVVSRCERGEDLDFDLFTGADDAAYDLFVNYYDDCWQALQEEKPKEAEKLLEEAAGLGITHPAMEICRGLLYLKQEKTDKAVAHMQALYERYPKDDMVAYHTAETYWKLEQHDKAADIYLKLKAENEKHYMANVRLTQWYYETGRYQEAKKCAEAVLSVGADDSFMETLTKVNAMLEHDLLEAWKKENKWESALELCWCYLQDGSTSRGLRLAKEIEKLISDEKQAEYAGLMAKLLVEQGEYDDAIAMSDIWENRLKEKMPKDDTEEERKKDEDRIRQSYMIRMQSYRFLGYHDKTYFPKAVEQIEAVETGTPKDIGLLLDKAQILMEMEEYERSLEITAKLIEEYQVYAAAASAMEVYRRQWNASGVVQNARICIQRFPSYIRAYDHLGRVFLDLGETEELQKLLDEAEKNKIESPYLEAYRYQMTKKPPEAEELDRKLEIFQKEYQEKVERGEREFYKLGLPIINEYLYWYPGAYMLRRRAGFHRSAMQYEQALADYEKALAEEPGNPYIHSNMAYIYRRQGEYEKALYHIKLAVLYAEEEAWKNILYCNMAKIYMLLGDNEQALKCFEYYEAHSDKDTSHMDDMAECLARLGRTEEAARKLALYYRKSDSEYYDGYLKALAEIWHNAGDFERLKQMLASWKKEKKIETANAGWIKRTLKIGNTDTDTIDYFCSAAWEALRQGDGKSAIELFREQIRLSEIKDKNGKTGLEDMIFAAILHGDREEGEKCAGKLKLWMNRDFQKPVTYYHDMPKGELTMRFLACYYSQTDEWLEELLDQEKKCAICDFCLMPRCKELEAMRILLLLRQGRRQEALERLRSNLEVQPHDEYMEAIAAVLKE